jgi:flagellar hook-associated protein 1 FlgK
VTIDLIQRFNLQFFDGRYRSTLAEAKNWEARSGVLTQAEAIMAETSTDGLLPKMDEFWASWESLSTDPTNDSLRLILLDNAKSLAGGFTRRMDQLTQLRGEQDLAVTDQVGMINSLATEVASLNSEISHVLSVGEQPNDLLDKRDLALDKLSELSGAVSFDQKFGQVTVSIGGHVLVVGNETFQLATKTRVTTPPAPADPVLDVVWADGQALVPPSGSLKGILDARDTFLKDQMTNLNTLAKTVIDQVNAIHITGYGYPPTYTPGSSVVSLTPNMTFLAPAIATGTPGTGVNGALSAGAYTLQARNNGGTRQFQLIDSSGTPVSILTQPPGTGYISGWQNMVPNVASVPYNTGRGLELTLNANDPALASVGSTISAQVYTNSPPFFIGNGAGDIAVNSALTPGQIATAFPIVVPGSPEPGNNANAVRIADLKFSKVPGIGLLTMNEYYNGQITNRALETQRAAENTTQRNIVMKSLEQLRESAAGVSLDEEAANMAKIQKAYQAAARVLTAYDEFLDIVINKMGLVGR